MQPRAHVRWTEFFGVRVRFHERVTSALACVEAALKRDCVSTPYKPMILSGWRDHNTYVSGEVSNHVYGIALDIDPGKNPCCGCIAPWNKDPRCRHKADAYERVAMPRCWIETFERYGFYWLGHDQLQDTMHFEFLGDPTQVLVDERAP